MSRRSNTNTPIAVVGVSALFPGSTDATGFWRDIMEGKDLVTEVPESHWLIDDYYDPDPKAEDKTYCKRGAFLDAVPFDCLDFGTPPSQVKQTDTIQLLALVVARKVLEDAARGSFEHLDRSGISVILGATGATELVVHLGSRLQRPIWLKALRDSGVPEDEAQAICQRIADSYVPWTEASFPGLLGNVVAGRIANRFDLGGTNCVVDAACASSQSAIAMALNELYMGQSDMVITGGVDTLNDILMYMCFSKTPALSPSGDCRPFSNAADGTILGEGLGMVALRRLEDAERDDDRIYAVIKGFGSSSDGKGTSVYAPNPKGQATCLRRAYAAAGHGPETVELIEAHGTGTKAGDKAEYEGLRTVFEESGRKDRWCALGSVKSQIGHTKGAAGAASVFKAVMALHHKVLPPTIKVEQPNPEMDLENSPFVLNTKARPWIRDKSHPRRASVSSFGFGGSNFHVVLEEYTGSGVREDLLRPSPTEMILLSAETPAELINNCRSVLKDRDDASALPFLARHTQESFSASQPARLGIVASDMEDLAKKLESATEAIENAPETSSQAPGLYYQHGGAESGGLAFLFPGQGSQYLDMGADLAMAFDDCRSSWDHIAEHRFKNGASLHSVTFPSTVFSQEKRDEQFAHLTKTQWAQPAIGAVSLSQMALLQSLGIRPDATAGHSFGELMALHAAGVVDADTVIEMAQKRGELMAEAAKSGAGSMTVVSAKISQVEALMAELQEKDVVIANLNGPKQVVLSGDTQAMERVETQLQQKKMRFKRLPVAAAFHSPLVSAAAEPFAGFLADKSFSAPQVPVYANATAAPYPNDANDARVLIGGQLAKPVRWVEQVEAMYAAGVRTFIEVGPGDVLTNLVKRCLPGKQIRAINLDHKTKHGLTCLWHALAQLAVEGRSLNLHSLWQNLAKADVPSKSKKKLSVLVKGVNNDKPYPPKNGSAGLPKPNPARVVSAAPVASKESNVTLPPAPAAKAQETAQPVSMPTVTPVPPAPVAQAPEASTARGPVSQQEGLHWVAAFQDVQQQTTNAHMAFLRVAERSMSSLENMLAGNAGIGQQPAPVAAPVAPPVPVPAPPQAVLMAPPAAMHAPTINKPLPVASRPVAVTRPPASESPAPQVAPKKAVVPAVDLNALMLEVVANKTGYPTDMLELGMTLEGDLGIDSIKRVEILSAMQESLPDMPKVDPTEMASLSTLAQIADYMAAKMGASTPAPVAVAEANAPSVDMNALMLEVVGEKTGYPAEMLELEMSLEADLGIDSIKRVEILSAMQDRLPDMPKVDPTEMASLSTLAQIVGYMAEKMGAAAPAAAPAQASTPAVDLSALMLDVVGEKTGYPAEMLEMEMSLEADLGIDSIKRVEILSAMQDKLPDMPKVDPTEMASLSTLAQIVEYMAKKAGVSTSPPAQPVAQASTAPSTQDMNALMLEVVADKTGYPAAMLELDMQLEADLGIDSIKRVEILSAVQDRVPDMPKVDPNALASLQTLGQIADYMANAGGASPAPAPIANEEPQQQIESEAISVGRYVPVLEAHPAPNLAPPFLFSGHKVYVTEDTAGFATKLATELRGRGIDAEVTSIVPSDARAVISLHGLSEVNSLAEAVAVNRDVFLLATQVAAAFEKQGGLFITVQDTAGDFGFSAKKPHRQWLGGLTGLVKTAAQEWPKAAVRAIDLECGSRSMNDLVEVLAREILNGGRELEVGLGEDDSRVTLRTQRQEADVAPSSIDANSVIVASGGGRGVTAATLIALAKDCGPSIALLGRTELEDEPAACKGVSGEAGLKTALLGDFRARSEKVTPKDLGRLVGRIQSIREIRATLEALKAAGSQARYYSCDITDSSSVKQALTSVRNEWGAITGIVHGAGVLADKMLSAKTEEHFSWVFGTKINGLRILLEETRDDALTSICLFSSVAARYGNAGQSDYAMANEVLNKVAHAEAKARPNCLVKSINWGPWESGMVTPALKAKFKEMGVPLIPLAEGADRFVAEMKASGAHREVVIGGPPQRGALISPKAPGEYWFDTLVGAGTHPYLLSHCVDGDVVVPMVLVLEWFLSAASSVNAPMVATSCRNLQVFRGILLKDFETEATRFKIRVVDTGSGPLQMTLLDTEDRPRYGAVVDMAATALAAEGKVPDLSLTEQTLQGSDLYGEKLFHGPDFAAIRRIDAMDKAGVRGTLIGTHHFDWPRDSRHTDPVVLDGGLQMALVWGYEQLAKRSLPTSFSEFRRYRDMPEGPVSCTLSGTIDEMIGSQSDLWFTDSEGNLLAELRGLRMHVIDPARQDMSKAAVLS